jgi:hypothetical protein
MSIFNRNISLNKYEAFAVIGLASAIVAGALVIDSHINTDEKGEQYLKTQGYTSVHILGNNYWCPKHTPLRKKFTAVDPQGQEVEGKFCAGRGSHFFNIVHDSIDTHPINKPNKPKM